MKEPTAFAIPPDSPFKALVWRELRQNLKWCALGMLGMTLALTWVLQRVARSYAGENVAVSVDIMSVFDVTSIATGVIGLLLGIAQTITENAGDRWGFLTHRPVSRSTLFGAKAISGSLFYF